MYVLLGVALKQSINGCIIPAQIMVIQDWNLQAVIKDLGLEGHVVALS